MKAKTARNQMIVEFLLNPKLTLKSVGMMFGISKQRVFAIRNAYQRPPEPSQTTLNPFRVLYHWLGTRFLKRGL